MYGMSNDKSHTQKRPFFSQLETPGLATELLISVLPTLVFVPKLQYFLIVKNETFANWSV